jgi:5-methylcytosine-specific restriction endonuclease McrA
MKPHQQRVLDFNPEVFYEKGLVDRYKRIQSIPINKFFPIREDKICACGCGKELKGRRTRWATDECAYFAQAVWGIINGHSEIITSYLKKIHKQWACCKCGLTDAFKEQKNGVCVSSIHKDHIVAVMNGGGGCWLDNYQLLCEDCHKEKTKNDFNTP